MGQICQLSDDTLASILSQLPLEEAIRTSILSSRWRHLWKRSTSLNFDSKKTFERIRYKPELRKSETNKFVTWVNHVLEAHDASSIEEFKVIFGLDKRFKFDIDGWIKFALSRKVQRLELNLLSGRKPYTFSLELLAGIEEICLNSRFGIMGNGMLADVKSLKEVSLKNLHVGGEVVEVLLLNCPYLERLSICGSCSLINLKVGGPVCALKYLVVMGCRCIKSIKISASNLVSFNYVGVKTNLFLENVPSLVDVRIGEGMVTSYFGGSMNDSFSLLSCCLKTLTLKPGIVGFVLPEWLPKLYALEQLIVEITASRDTSFLNYATFIEVAPHLQKFAFQAAWDYSNLSVCKRKVQRCVRHFHHRCLKEVRLGGYYGRKSDLEVAIFFLENAVALEKMIINPRDESSFLPDYAFSRQRAARSRAKHQLDGIVPAGVKLVIL
ncbi:F-box protein At5g03100-like isoform X3 [Rhododendron vialii]|uniref:F-box protein At5g03100-like isoform X2 n=1 Tax=Rhododendron vialii TaxID=182163 RepID=UPI00265F49EF|nr:F-box protein At5g03100-like isoform X2 [Rhododendron vialii]XP_058203957.1 F-box protein At5g03100-like isoform X3 [Rhododendron vialii]